jgi:hypothetical protein
VVGKHVLNKWHLSINEAVEKHDQENHGGFSLTLLVVPILS